MAVIHPDLGSFSPRRLFSERGSTFRDILTVPAFSGAPHPFDINDYLILAHPNRALDYELV